MPPNARDSKSPGRTKHQVFLCYSHADEQWRDRVEIHLMPLRTRIDIDVWSDKRLRPGDDWKQAITEAISRARFAVLLVSADFLASAFIAEVELPSILQSVAGGKCKVISVIVSPSLFLMINDLARYQTVNDPESPVVDLGYGARERVFKNLAATIFDAVSTEDANNHGDTVAIGAEQFNDPDSWDFLLKLGNWDRDASTNLISGQGVHSYLLSRKTYGGDRPFTISTKIEFDEFHGGTTSDRPHINAGIVVGWARDAGNPSYVNIEFTGTEARISAIGQRGGNVFEDWEHLTTTVPFPLLLGYVYEIRITYKESRLLVELPNGEQLAYTFHIPNSGRIGLRPWRSKMRCHSFAVSS